MRPEAAWKAGQLHAVQLSSSSPEPGELAGLARRVHHALARTTRTAWLLATGEDLRYPATEGARLNVQTRILHRYLSRLLRVLGGNRTVNAAFLDVANLVQPSATLSHPRFSSHPGRLGPTCSAPHRPPHQARPDQAQPRHHANGGGRSEPIQAELRVAIGASAQTNNPAPGCLSVGIAAA